MTSWLTASIFFVVFAFLAVMFSIALHNWRNNRWLASLFFYLSVACALMSFPVFFVTGFAGGK